MKKLTPGDRGLCITGHEASKKEGEDVNPGFRII